MRSALAKLALLLFCCGLIATAILSARNRLPEIGDRLKRENIPASASKATCGIPPPQMYPCFFPVVDGVKYAVIFDGSTLLVKSLYTNDRKFRTADGYRVGDVIDVSERSLIIFKDWDIFAPRRRDGWNPIVGHDICGPDGNSEKFDPCGYFFRKNHPGKAKIEGFLKGQGSPDRLSP